MALCPADSYIRVSDSWMSIDHKVLLDTSLRIIHDPVLVLFSPQHLSSEPIEAR